VSPMKLPPRAITRRFDPLSTAMANAIPVWVGLYSLAFQLIGDRFG
jgi:hypothetical protein